MRKVSIIIPVRNGIKYLPLTIESIMKTTYPNYKIIIVESESDDGVNYYCDYLASRYPFIKVIHTKKEGITKAINKGIEASDADSDVLLTQNDVVFPSLVERDWLSMMVGIADSDGCIGIVTCMNGGGVSGPDYLDGFKWVGTWCMYVKRETLKKVGLFDESFSPGPGDDICFTYRVYKSGFYIGMANFAVDHHRLGENYNDSSELCQKGAKRFREKYDIQNTK